MIIKLTIAGRNEATYVNFDYVRTFRRDSSFTELVLSDDKYHKIAVLETPEEIYEMLYPTKTCSGNCSCHSTEAKKPEVTTAEAASDSAVKKTTTKKTTNEDTE